MWKQYDAADVVSMLAQSSSAGWPIASRSMCFWMQLPLSVLRGWNEARKVSHCSRSEVGTLSLAIPSNLSMIDEQNVADRRVLPNPRALESHLWE